MRERPDRACIKLEWIALVISQPTAKTIQTNGRIRCWGRIEEADNKYLRVILLEDGETVHNAFFDRRFNP